MKKSIIILIICLSLFGCTQYQGDSNNFELFKNTPNWKLAQALDREDKQGIENILKQEKINIDFQEPKYGKTLLNVAIANDKPFAAELLLENGTNLNITDSFKLAPIHKATEQIVFKKHAAEIIQLLIKFGANVNDTALKFKGKTDTVSYKYTPLMGTIDDTACTRLLLDNGANLYFKNGDEFPIWISLFGPDSKLDKRIFVAKYLIVDKRLPIPNPIFYRIYNHEPVDALTKLKEYDPHGDIEKQKAKDKILEYLNSIHFPDKGVYHK